LTEAAERGDLEAACSLIAQGADVNLEDGEGWTPLMWAALKGHPAVMKALLDSGAEVDLPDGGANGWTALMFALHHDQHEAVRLLLDSGADVNFKNRSGMTPLMIATGDYETQGSAETVRMLMERGADPHMRARWGGTALTNAVAWNRIEIVKVLLEKAPDLKLGDDLAGQIALFFARMRGSEKLLALLEKTGTVAKADGSVPLP